MEHIRQKLDLTSNKLEIAYTVVITDGYTDLTTHPSIIEHPDLFEIVDVELPTEYQFLNYNG
jgi:hypothetical protein